MKFKHLIGWGIITYAIIYLLVAMLSLYGWYPSILGRIITLMVLVATLLLAGDTLHLHSVKDILPYSFFWALEAAGLDALLSVPYVGWGLYLNANLWVGYALVLCVPLFAALHSKRSSAIPHL